MKKSHSFRRSVRHSLLALGLLALVAGLLGIGSTASAAPASCEVDNSTTSAAYSSVQAAIDTAGAGNTLEVKGTCVGTSTVTKNLRIKGGSPDVSILDGGGAGSTLSVNPSGKVALIVRGTCVFSDKAANAAAAGATAAVIFNSQPGAFPQATRLVNPVTIPVVGISGAAGRRM